MSASYEADCPAAYRQMIEGRPDAARGGFEATRPLVPQHEQGDVTGILVAALCEIAASAPAEGPATSSAPRPRRDQAATITAGAAPPALPPLVSPPSDAIEDPPTVRSADAPPAPHPARPCLPPPLPSSPTPTSSPSPPPPAAALRVTIRPASPGSPSQWQDICWDRPTLPVGTLGSLPPGDPAAATERAGRRGRARGALDLVVMAIFALALFGLCALAYFKGWHNIWAALG
jgi:hypothetical protein